MYVLSGWEGSAHDSKVLSDALARKNGLKVPQGKYYLVDCGFPNRRKFLAPYRGVRYHLQDFAGHGNDPENEKELFNLRHASLRNVIERIFVYSIVPSPSITTATSLLSKPKIYSIAPSLSITTATSLLHHHRLRHRFLRKKSKLQSTPSSPLPPSPSPPPSSPNKKSTPSSPLSPSPLPPPSSLFHHHRLCHRFLGKNPNYSLLHRPLSPSPPPPLSQLLRYQR
ncbi:hypothetical protein JHK82_033526 [Glycine max]|nr:hypothetical protein JHK82_033526 [Glycine max]